MGRRVTFGLEEVPGYRAGGRAPAGVVVLHAGWGLTPPILGVAERLAAAGLCALSPDLFRGRVTADADEARSLAAALDTMSVMEGDIAAALAHLREEQGCDTCAVLGFGMGGALSLLAGIYHARHLRAAVSVGGISARDMGDPRRVGVPFQGHFGTADPTCPPRAISALEAGLRAADAPFAVFTYEGARQDFWNEQRPDLYSEAAAADAWERTLAFLRRHLLPG